MSSTDKNNVVLASIYRMTAVNFWESGKILHQSFQSKNESLPRNIRALPFYYLVSHACELLLKCALLKRGVTEPELRTYHLRHDLSELLNLLETKNINISPHARDVVQKLAEQHKEHTLRYTALLDDGNKVFTPYAECIYQTLEELLMHTSLAFSNSSTESDDLDP